MYQKCIICKSKLLSIKEVLPLFSHSDFSTVSNKMNFKRCKKCELIINFNLRQKKFFSKKYFKLNKNEHKISLNNINSLNRSKIVSQIIKKKLKKFKNLNILDIGCANGNLLYELSKKCPNNNFFGLEKNIYFKKEFPKKKNFFFFKSINRTKEKFDIIIFSHSLFYFKNLKKIIDFSLKILSKKGKLFIIIPNIAKNPFYALAGDQKAIFTKNNIKNIFRYFRFNLSIVKSSKISNELIFYGVNKKNTKKLKYCKDNDFDSALKFLKKKKRKISKANIARPIILGTKIVAAAVDEFLNKKTVHYFESNFDSSIRTFREKPIKPLKKNNTVIDVIPSFNVSKNKKIILERRYNLKLKNYAF